VVRAIDNSELAERRKRLRARLAADAAERTPSPDAQPELDPTAFVANTASLSGRVVAGPHTSVWYGCGLDAAGGEIVIRDRTNVQDNSVLRCTPGARLVLGEDTTIGHNVTMADCTIGDRCLIGIGSVVAPGTVAEDDVFLAAGAATSPGQVLAAGHLYGGQPARVIAPLDERKRALIKHTIGTYCEYAEELARVQKQAVAAR
jgi:gamma-carbonic anhydrase